MKAIVIDNYGDPDVLRLSETADPAGAGEDVLVGIRAVGLNRADLLERRGLYPPPPPRAEVEIPGLEFAGEVIGVGDRVSGLAEGDRVMGITAAGAYAEKIAVHHRLLAPIPPQLDWVQAAAIPEAFVTAIDALMQCDLRCGESVLIHAAGSGVGSAAVQIARVMGASPVLATSRTKSKLEAVAPLGIDVAIDSSAEDFAESAQRATEGRGVDVIMDFVGAAYLAGNVRALAVGGRMVVVGMLGGIAAELDLAAMLAKRLRICGTTLRARPLEGKAAAVRSFVRSVLPHIGAGRVRPLVDRVFALSDAAAAHRYMESNANVGKIVLTV